MTRWHGHDDRDRVLPVREPDGAGRAGCADRRRQFAVARRLAVRDLAQRGPHPQLERRAARVQRQVETPPLTGEVLAELGAYVVERGVVAAPVRARLGARPADSAVSPSSSRAASSAPSGEPMVVYRMSVMSADAPEVGVQMCPEVAGGVAAPWRPVGPAVGERRARDRRRRGARRGRLAAARRGRRRPACQIVGGPRPDPGQREQGRAGGVPIGGGIESAAPRSRTLRRRRGRCGPGPRHRQQLGGSAAARPGGREVPPRLAVEGRPAVFGHDAGRARCARYATEICCPTIVRIAVS